VNGIARLAPRAPSTRLPFRQHHSTCLRKQLSSDFPPNQQTQNPGSAKRILGWRMLWIQPPTSRFANLLITVVGTHFLHMQMGRVRYLHVYLYTCFLYIYIYSVQQKSGKRVSVIGDASFSGCRSHRLLNGGQ
jgi:hypothetical protein